MRLSKFYRTIRYKGSLTVVMNSIQFTFKWLKANSTEIEITTKAGIDKKLTQEAGFEIHNWERVQNQVHTFVAWNMYENIKNNGTVLLKLKDVNKEYWLEKDEI